MFWHTFFQNRRQLVFKKEDWSRNPMIFMHIDFLQQIHRLFFQIRGGNNIYISPLTMIGQFDTRLSNTQSFSEIPEEASNISTISESYCVSVLVQECGHMPNSHPLPLGLLSCIYSFTRPYHQRFLVQIYHFYKVIGKSINALNAMCFMPNTEGLVNNNNTGSIDTRLTATIMQFELIIKIRFYVYTYKSYI